MPQVGNYEILFRPQTQFIKALTPRTALRLAKVGPPKYVIHYIESHKRYQGYLYLIHFKEPYKHARHYLGFTANVYLRELRHIAGHGARLMQVVEQHGIDWKIVKLWYGDRYLERRLRNHSSTRYCPVCRGEVTYEGVSYEEVLEQLNVQS